MRSFVDPYCPINWSHPLARGILSAWGVVSNTGWQGGNVLRDAVIGTKKATVGTLTGGPTWNAALPGGGRAMRFDGVNDYVDCGSNSAFRVNTFSFACWAMKHSNGADYGIASAGTSSWYFRFHNTDTLQLVKAGTLDIDNSATTLTTNVWYRAGITVQDNGANRTYTFYLNGKADGSSTTTQTFAAGSSNFLFGADTGPGEYISGKIGAAILWNRELNAAEMREDYREARSGFPTLLNWVDLPVVRDAASDVATNQVFLLVA